MPGTGRARMKASISNAEAGTRATHVISGALGRSCIAPLAQADSWAEGGSDPLDGFAGLYSRVDDAARACARLADTSGIIGFACERSDDVPTSKDDESQHINEIDR
ncbi:hypothetical protein [Pandoraea sputorum]|uniref:hypothetical protein n=1 Tax=Pandoraea sputorum TaxID=93222 RepID=UPI0012543A3B|nr:hypothetical protein [Pandoraea sputorum]VVE55114.1 hypothetical protein PSP20601_04961 [Pandoraea sputorum]